MSRSPSVAPRTPRRARLAVAIALAVGVGALVALAGSDGEPAGRSGDVRADGRGDASTPATQGRGDVAPRPVLLVRRIGELPAPVLRRARALAGARVSVGFAGRVALLRSRSAAGRLVDRPPPGFGIPLELVAIEPRTYAPLVPPAARDAIRGLGRAEALLTRTAARLRRLGPGGRIRLAEGRTLRVAGVIDDGLVRRAEIVVSAAEGASLGAQRRWALVPYSGDPVGMARSLQRAGGRELRVRNLGRAPWPSLFQILPQAALKERFGEFAVRLGSSGRDVVVEPRWVERNIVAASVPILGSVSCHRDMIPALRRALGELERRGLVPLVDPSDYAGCYAAKDIPTTGGISRHAWGLAIDFNAAANPYGSPSRQDQRLVEVMERNGFAWGGRWPTPDAMHFEYVGKQPAAGG